MFRLRLLLLTLYTSGCLLTTARPVTWTQSRSLDAVILPGCPSNDDGSLSRCQRERVVWGAKLVHEGVTDTLIVSGAAVYTPYVEADALAAGLQALGVQPSQILREPDALHSNENGAYALAVAEAHGLEQLGVCSQAVHANTITKIMRAYGHQDVTALELNWVVVARELRNGSPTTETLDWVRTEPVDDWVPLEERDRDPRPPSSLTYTSILLRGLFTDVPRPEPPEPPVAAGSTSDAAAEAEAPEL